MKKITLIFMLLVSSMAMIAQNHFVHGYTVYGYSDYKMPEVRFMVQDIETLQPIGEYFHTSRPTGYYKVDGLTEEKEYLITVFCDFWDWHGWDNPAEKFHPKPPDSLDIAAMWNFYYNGDYYARESELIKRVICYRGMMDKVSMKEDIEQWEAWLASGSFPQDIERYVGDCQAFWVQRSNPRLDIRLAQLGDANFDNLPSR